MILTDVDDCLLDWIGGFRTFLESRGIKVKTQRPMNWDLSKWVEHDNVVSLIEEFNSSPAFGELAPMPGAVEAVEALAKKHVLIAISSCGFGDKIARLRRQNLQNVFGYRITGVHCVGLGESKVEYLKAYSPEYGFWIEDKWENAVHGAELGFHTLLLDRPYNGGHAEDVRVKRMGSWSQLVEQILLHSKQVEPLLTPA